MQTRLPACIPSLQRLLTSNARELFDIMQPHLPQLELKSNTATAIKTAEFIKSSTSVHHLPPEVCVLLFVIELMEMTQFCSHFSCSAA